MDCDGQIGQLRLGLFENVDETIEGFAESGLCRPKPVAGLAKDGDVGPVGLVHGQGQVADGGPRVSPTPFRNDERGNDVREKRCTRLHVGIPTHSCNDRSRRKSYALCSNA